MSTLSKIVEEFDELIESKQILDKIKAEFKYTKPNADFVEYMQKWKDAQPLTNMSIIEKLDDLWNKADDVACNCSSYEDEVSRAMSALEDVPYDVSSDAYGLQTDIEALKNEIKNPKEQADAEVEDKE